MRVSEYTFTFSKDNKPVAYVKENELITFVCEDCYCGQVKGEETLVSKIEDENDNPATGPVFVENAEVGDVLVVNIKDIRVNNMGVAAAMQHCGPLWKEYEERTHVFDIVENRVYWKKKDISWEMKPMIGVIGTAHNQIDIKTMAVGDHGGNIDSPIICKDTKLYIPVRVKGALLSMGDLHASMGDGEMCGNGIEISGEVDVTLQIIKNFTLHWPLSETKDAYFVHTNGETCDLAIQRGYEEMTRLVCNAYGWDLTDASIYLSLQAYVCANQACLSPNNGGNSFRVGVPKIEKRLLIGEEYE